MTGIRERKKRLRALALERRNALSPAEAERAGAAIQERVLALPELTRAATVACYLAAGIEAPTSRILEWCWDSGKCTCVPAWRRTQKRYEFCLTERGSILAAGRFGLSEPAEFRPVEPAGIGLVVVPGLAFDREGRRLGRGKGYYDALLAGEAARAAFRVGIAFDCQLFDRVPAEACDVDMDMVVTERGTFPARAGRAANGGADAVPARARKTGGGQNNKAAAP